MPLTRTGTPPGARPARRRLRAALVASPLALALAGGLAAGPALGAGSATATTSTAQAVPADAPYRNASLPTGQRVADLLSRMTLAEKIGQMTQAERADIDADPSQIASYGLGSVLSGGGSVPADNTPTGWADMVDRYQRAAMSTRLGIPLLYGIDSVHGNNNLYGATVFPHDIGLGATRDPALVERIEHITATETRAVGPNWAFAPCLCVARDDRWGRTYESFGEDPALVSTMSVAVRGLQGPPGQLDHADRVLATAKHFAGDGLTAYGTGSGDYTIDQGIDVVTRQQWEQLALAPFVPAVKKYDVGSVMPSFSSVDWIEDGVGNPTKMTGNEQLLTGVLKGRLGFDGFVISDWRAIHQLPGDYRHQVKTAVDAGLDMAMEPYSGDTVGWREFESTLTDLVRSGDVTMSRIDDAVTRILTKKVELGLFEHPYTDRSNIGTVGSAAHRAVARKAVQESQVLLKNANATLPLTAGAPVYVAGSNADDLGNQAGGWTLSWQGQSGQHVIPGTTILDGIREHATGTVTTSTDASAPVPAGANGVVVVGETPYAEGFGDVGGPTLNGPNTMKLSDADTKAVRTVCAKAATCTVVVVSGRPVVMPADLLDKVDALVAAWLPGSEGAGVADDLYGAARYTGRLPVSWPRSIAQEPINVGDGKDPLYPYGFGLNG
ncbi:glycoside hydrolase family 3 protein [Lapillicoccus jejuensis]|uniref:beta-glucosidase n=1 Tax=Lapillicoccus jejuensis TaxID=402171 RepID=A0A542E1A5_9MICO|nr:glycoside hydrolase family 3 protein [Lapillicoccus jejuensis]TQJ08984.1 beta-glucosidase [Lapillicoccus jejuensis]